MEIKNLSLYGRIVATVFISIIVANIIMMVAVANPFLIIILYGIFVIIPALIIGFIIFVFLQRTSLARFVNKRSIGVVCVITAIIIIVSAINFTINTLPPSELFHTWRCDEGQVMCVNDSNCAVLDLGYDPTYGRKSGSLSYRFVNSSYLGYSFEWDFDKSSEELKLYDYSREWEVILRIEFIGNKKMITHYICDKNVPFNATLFDGLSWTVSE